MSMFVDPYRFVYAVCDNYYPYVFAQSAPSAVSGAPYDAAMTALGVDYRWLMVGPYNTINNTAVGEANVGDGGTKILSAQGDSYQNPGVHGYASRLVKGTADNTAFTAFNIQRYFGADANITTGMTFTVGMWVYAGTQDGLGTENDFDLFGSCIGGSFNMYRGVFVDVVAGGYVRVQFGDGVGNAGGNRRSYQTAAGAFPFGAATFVCLVVRNTSTSVGAIDFTLYINGAAVSCPFTGGSASAIAWPGGAAWFMKHQSGSANAFYGQVDDIFLHMAEISASDIANLYSIGTTSAVDDPNLMIGSYGANMSLHGYATHTPVLDKRPALLSPMGTVPIRFANIGGYPANNWATTGGQKTTGSAPICNIGTTTDYTFEFYMRTSEFVYNYTSNLQFVLDYRPNGADGAYPALYLNNANKLVYHVSGAARITSTTVLSTLTWYHVAICRASGITRMFINGALEGSFTDNLVTAISQLIHGVAAVSTTGYGFNGWFSDYRATIGAARYTSAFTRPATPFGTERCSNSASPPDPYWYSVASQMRFPVGTWNGSTIDEAPNGLPVTWSIGGSGAVLSSTRAKFGTYSMYFPGGAGGTAGYIVSDQTSPTAMTLETATRLTVEMWIYVETGSKQNLLMTKRGGSSSAGWGFRINNTNLLQFYFTGGSSLTSSATVPTGQWVHVAFTRFGANAAIYINGVQSGTSATWADGTALAGTSVYIGYNNGDPVADNFHGYIDSYRISYRQVYSGNFTPPAMDFPTAFAGTLTTKFLLHMNGANASTSFPDSGPNAVTVTAVGNAQVSTANSMFGGASAVFDGAGDYLSIPDAAGLEIGSNSMTFSCWVRSTTIAGGTAEIFSKRLNNSVYAPIVLYRSGGNISLQMCNSSGAWQLSISGASITANTWYHVAVVRDSVGNVVLYVNGRNSASGTLTGSAIDNADAWLIGGDTNTNYWAGNIDEVLYEHGARWNDNFVVPQNPFT
jgi:hypothetical protein